MDTGTAQILVFGFFVLAFSAFASYMAARQGKSEADHKASGPHTLL